MGFHMIIICSWCKKPLGWVSSSKGESHGICEKCLQEYFPDQAENILLMMHKNGLPKTSLCKSGSF